MTRCHGCVSQVSHCLTVTLTTKQSNRWYSQEPASHFLLTSTYMDRRIVAYSIQYQASTFDYTGTHSRLLWPDWLSVVTWALGCEVSPGVGVTILTMPSSFSQFHIYSPLTAAPEHNKMRMGENKGGQIVLFCNVSSLLWCHSAAFLTWFLI